MLKSLKLKKEVVEKLRENGFIIDNNKFDLGIAIGGDGSFLRMIKDNNFDSDTYYIGINAGTLGFAQEVEISDIEKFMIDLKNDKMLLFDSGLGHCEEKMELNTEEIEEIKNEINAQGNSNI